MISYRFNPFLVFASVTVVCLITTKLLAGPLSYDETRCQHCPIYPRSSHYNFEPDKGPHKAPYDGYRQTYGGWGYGNKIARTSEYDLDFYRNLYAKNIDSIEYFYVGPDGAGFYIDPKHGDCLFVSIQWEIFNADPAACKIDAN